MNKEYYFLEITNYWKGNLISSYETDDEKLDDYKVFDTKEEGEKFLEDLNIENLQYEEAISYCLRSSNGQAVAEKLFGNI